MKKTLLLSLLLAFSLLSNAQLISLTPEFTIELPDLENNDFGNLDTLGVWSTKVIIKRATAGTSVTLTSYGHTIDTLPFGAVVINDSTKYGNFSTDFISTPNSIEFSDTDLEKETTLTILFGNAFQTGSFTYEKILTRYIRQLGRVVTYSESIPYTSSIEGQYEVRLFFYKNSQTYFSSDPIRFSYKKTNLNVEETVNNNAVVFPNPTSDFINLPANYNWSVWNSTGQSILNGTGNSVNIADQPAGIYFVRMEKDGNVQFSRVIKK